MELYETFYLWHIQIHGMNPNRMHIYNIPINLCRPVGALSHPQRQIRNFRRDFSSDLSQISASIESN